MRGAGAAMWAGSAAGNLAALAILGAAMAAISAGAGLAALTPFSAASPGAPVPSPWRELSLPSIKAPEFSMVEDQGSTVLRVRAAASAGSLAHALSADPAAQSMLAWRWKVDRVVEKADLARKDSDDFAARIYVFFDMPESDLPLLARAKMRLAKLLYGADMPVAALCYVWDNRHAPETTAWNAYTDRVRMIVVRSGTAGAGRWMDEARDLDADFRAAFGASWKKPTPRITGVAVGADTDQTGEAVTAWFGNLRLQPRR